MTEAPVAETPTKRGRPRPDTTIERDDRVLAHLGTSEGRTRRQLATELDLPDSEIYLSLYRLSRTTPPKIVKNAGNVWTLTPADVPAG